MVTSDGHNIPRMTSALPWGMEVSFVEGIGVAGTIKRGVVSQMQSECHNFGSRWGAAAGACIPIAKDPHC